jgi:mRNA interferase MazF
MTAGDVVLLHFPFTDLSGTKFRPAVVLAVVDREDFIACQITSRRNSDRRAIELTDENFSDGGLRIVSYARPGKLFTAHRKLVSRLVGRMQNVTLGEIRGAVVNVIQEG